MLVDRALAIVLVVASRGDSVNRLPGQLEWIQSTLGEEALGSVVVVVASTRPGQRPWQSTCAHISATVSVRSARSATKHLSHLVGRCAGTN
ncbi:hypothetical protein GS416_05565 [Rhodococcus hoagii]|nr:hypothetical protein [Prescottella equi]